MVKAIASPRLDQQLLFGALLLLPREAALDTYRAAVSPPYGGDHVWTRLSSLARIGAAAATAWGDTALRAECLLTEKHARWWQILAEAGVDAVGEAREPRQDARPEHAWYFLLGGLFFGVCVRCLRGRDKASRAHPSCC